MLIMLRTDWPADTFRRGGIAFQRGVPVDCDEATVKLVAGDLSKSLVLVSPTTAKADHDATKECAADAESFLSRMALATGSKKQEDADNSPAGSDSAAETTTPTTTMAEPPPTVGTESQPTPRRKR